MPTDAEDGLDSLYSQEEPMEGKESIDQEQAEEMETSAVVPVKLLQGSNSEPVKEGDEIMVKVKAVHGEEATVIYAPAKPGEKEGGGEEPAMHGPEDLDKMNNSEY
jgi:hypothetical protein